MQKNRIKEALALYFIMGTPNVPNGNPLDVLEAVLRGGATCFQLREKGDGALTGDALVSFAKECQQLCKTYQVPFIINDDVDLAVALDADGVHVGQDDEHAAIVRERIGSDKWLGISTHNTEEAGAAIEMGADYIGIGPIYPTATKLDAQDVVGASLVQTIHNAFPELPSVGIGGISASNFSPVLEAGADGVAVISALTSSTDPYKAAKELSKAIHTTLKR